MNKAALLVFATLVANASAEMLLPDPQEGEHPPLTILDNWVIDDAPTVDLYQASGKTFLALVACWLVLWTIGKVAGFFIGMKRK